MRRLSRLALAALLGSVAVLHVINPRFFERLIPAWLPGSPTVWNVAATAAEGTSAVLLAREHTARAGGWVAFATFAVVWVANLDHARLGHVPGTDGWFATREAALLRAPLQIPLLWWAWRIAHRDDTGEAEAE